MDYGLSDSSGTDDDLPPSHQNRFQRGGRTAARNGRSAVVGSGPLPRVHGDMETQIHLIEQEAYCAVLRAFKAQSDALTLEKESLITELRKELRVSDQEHRELLLRVNADDIIRRIREWRTASGLQPGMLSSKMSHKMTSFTSKMDNFEEIEEGSVMSFLDLPEFPLECILERLPPASLCSMAGVCSSLRSRCISDHFWEKHMKKKWGRIIGPAAYIKWQWHVALRKDSSHVKERKPKDLLGILSIVRPFWWIKSKVDDSSKQSSLPDDSIMAWFLALETGRFSFPAQVYNRENGHVELTLSCYDAELSYDPHTDTFQARYPPHGRRAVAIENGVKWERLRAPPVDTAPHDLHISDCLNDLCPGDSIEIQWRTNIEFPYGWWYAVVGHLESCDGNENYCRCHNSDTVVVVFNQYTPGSLWRRTTINRRHHREEGNVVFGFYGGIRKLRSEEEISTWKRFWPSKVLE